MRKKTETSCSEKCAGPSPFLLSLATNECSSPWSKLISVEKVLQKYECEQHEQPIDQNNTIPLFFSIDSDEFDFSNTMRYFYHQFLKKVEMDLIEQLHFLKSSRFSLHCRSCYNHCKSQWCSQFYRNKSANTVVWKARMVTVCSNFVSGSKVVKKVQSEQQLQQGQQGQQGQQQTVQIYDICGNVVPLWVFFRILKINSHENQIPKVRSILKHAHVWNYYDFSQKSLNVGVTLQIQKLQLNIDVNRMIRTSVLYNHMKCPFSVRIQETPTDNMHTVEKNTCNIKSCLSRNEKGKGITQYDDNLSDIPQNECVEYEQARNHPIYGKFLKMREKKIPDAAIRQKMILENVKDIESPEEESIFRVDPKGKIPSSWGFDSANMNFNNIIKTVKLQEAKTLDSSEKNTNEKNFGFVISLDTLMSSIARLQKTSLQLW